MTIVEDDGTTLPTSMPDVDGPDAAGHRTHVSVDHTVVAAITGAAAVLAALGDAAPTGTPWWDLVLRAGVAALFVQASARSHNFVVIAAAIVAAVFVGTSIWLIVAVGGFLVALAGFTRRKGRVEKYALSGALTIQVLLHLTPAAFFGLPSLIAGTVVLVVFLNGYRNAGVETKQRLNAGVGIVLMLGVIAVAVGGFVALGARDDANTGVDAARRGLSLARQGETQALVAELETAQASFASANNAMTSPLLRPLSLIPIVAQNHRALETATEQGLIVATEAAGAAQDADLDQLQLRQGQFDLDLLAAMAPRLRSAADGLVGALDEIDADRSPWLLPQLDDQLQTFVDEVVDVLPEAQVAAEAAAVMPDMLGASGERRYLMLFGAPGESREFGGFIGGFALIGVNDGSLDLVEAGSINNLLVRAREEQLDDPAGYPAEFEAVDPAFFPQNLTSTPNIGVIARAVRDIFPELAGAPIDGVIYADPYALAAMTEFTGPISVQGVPEALDREGLVSFMFADQYRLFTGRADRFDAIGNMAAATAAGFEGADLPGPERLGQVLGPAARAGRLQVVTYDDRENAFLASVRLQRDFSAPTSVDSVAVIQTNATASKLDLYLHREVDYDVQIAADGTLRATVDVVLRSDMSGDVPELTLGETDGTNEVLLSLYSPHDLTGLTVNGQPHEYVTHGEFGFNRYALFKIALPPNGAATAHFELEGQAPPGDYRLIMWAQPLANFDMATISYRAEGDEPTEQTRELDESWLFEAVPE